MIELKHFENVLVSYIRTPDKYGAKLYNEIIYDEIGESIVLKPILTYEKGKKIGIVVAIGPGIIGWSKCMSIDTYDNKLGLHIALKRAMKALTLTYSERIEFIDSAPLSIQEDITKMLERSYKYFQIPDDE